MTTLGEMIALFVLAILVGRLSRRVNHWTYLVIVVIALIQVGLTLLSMYNMEAPKLFERFH
jgi:heme/copper-type cytochrome/quinol oxidase subunit 4